ncbi:MAG: hypothetical protein GTO63_06185 [Anaerolineae bacterium]|nr:hypothetical protein [Anaerolineae bacterium]NIN94572.1 hypothetical protein [Anaerolineae bacterium]NIQ77633.1 hypothetical protein [Anaerolineae bacterium]
MAARLRIFTSVAPDLRAEREIIGRAIASLPVSLGWVINYTPSADEALGRALDAVAAADFYMILLGTDIRAPMGSEFVVARRTGKRILAYVEDVLHTPAARVFMRYASLNWQHFSVEEELGPLLLRGLAEQILEAAEAYPISPVDWEAVLALLEELTDQEQLEPEKQKRPPEYRGAGKDAVIVSPERDLPRDGVLIEKSQGSN